jgi:DNA-directed RNA polymerase subunit RPC12/RpoP
MGEAGLTGARCSDCGHPYPDSEELAGMHADERPKCENCGSRAVTFELHASETVTMHSQIGLKQKRPGSKKPLIEHKEGDDLHRDSGRWMKLTRRVDRTREPAWYSERIVDPETDEVLREVDEPLSEHQGRGSSRPK